MFLSGPLAHADIPALCQRIRVLLESCDGDTVDCHIGELVEPDAVTVHALARMQLTARRLGHRIRLRDAGVELRELLVLMGLADVLPTAGLRVEPGGQAEEREQTCGVEEEADPGDPAT